jgi:hypothetical protein
MRAWLVCVVASGCYLQPTVFEGGTPPPPLLEPPPPPPSPSPDVVGCITHEPSYRRRSPGTWWIGERRVTSTDVDHAIAASPVATPAIVRALRTHRAFPAFAISGMALAQASLVSAVLWAGLDQHSGLAPLWMLAPLSVGAALIATAISTSSHAEHVRTQSIDAFNAAATREDRCPPTGTPP